MTIVTNKWGLVAAVVTTLSFVAAGHAEGEGAVSYTVEAKVSPASCEITVGTNSVDLGNVAWTESGLDIAAHTSETWDLITSCSSPTKHAVMLDVPGVGADTDVTYKGLWVSSDAANNNVGPNTNTVMSLGSNYVAAYSTVGVGQFTGAEDGAIQCYLKPDGNYVRINQSLGVWTTMDGYGVCDSGLTGFIPVQSSMFKVRTALAVPKDAVLIDAPADKEEGVGTITASIVYL